MATKELDRILQLKITLLGSKPPIWRRIQIPANISFHQLHNYIQFAMGWENCHLYGFRVMPTGKKAVETSYYGNVGILIDDESVKSPKSAKVADYLTLAKQEILYCYDFGDDWMHKIVLEEILAPASGKKYPLCLDGKRACPPEDCGGVYAYQEALEAISDPEHPDYEDVIEWFDEDFDPEDFDPKDVVFSELRMR
ncbi:MAG: plasmid pRiA4b ORF-3 family protein [Candidatus Cloacimonadaceae bacterium]|nr:plasmid pRiA4b ORF-3 family protein [Candidatus Cloacimonadaceae bacterium]MDP3115060.1 plasmid pRiA4b ORF-3 family protein [Candidatus Cloacimonadaceae bacterium]